jgi:hypothetical protein
MALDRVFQHPPKRLVIDSVEHNLRLDTSKVHIQYIRDQAIKLDQVQRKLSLRSASPHCIQSSFLLGRKCQCTLQVGPLQRERT